MKKRLVYLWLILTQLKPVLAYIDPGTGGMIITSAWSLILAILTIIGAFFVKIFFKPIKKTVLRIWSKIKKKKHNKRKILIKLILFVFTISMVLIFYFTNIEKGVNMENMKYKKVAVIGIDGMDPKITNKLMLEGKLQNFKKLAETGSLINLNTSYPPHSPVAWTSIATGVNPGKHNIFDFIKRNPENYLPELALSKTNGILGTKYISDIKAEPFWRITSKKGLSTTIIRWPNTFPPEKINGNMLSGEGVPDIKGFMSGYTLYTEKKQDKKEVKSSNKIIQVKKNNNLIETELSGPKTKKAGDIIDIKIPMKIILSENSANLVINGKEHKIELNKWSDFIKVKFKIGVFKEVGAVFKAYIISIEPFEMFITTIQIDPENPIIKISYPNEYSRDLANDIGTYYTLGMPEETDAYIDGALSKKAFLEQVNEIEKQRDKMFWKEFNEFKNEEIGVFAFVYDSSDRLQHLFWDKKVLEKINEVIENYYVQKDAFIAELLGKLDNVTLLIVVSDHGFTSFEKAVSINTWLVENGFMELTKELDDEEMPLFQYVDWEKTKAYSLGFNSIYINLKGREGKGIVEEKEKIVNEIIEKLENLIDKKTGKKVINKAYKREEIYKGEYVESAPDIIIGFNPGYRMSWQTAAGGFTKEVLNDNLKKWKGDHLVDPKFVQGVLFSNIKINKKEASQIDVAPTVLDALGIEIPENMDGKSLLK